MGNLCCCLAAPPQAGAALSLPNVHRECAQSKPWAKRSQIHLSKTSIGSVSSMTASSQRPSVTLSPRSSTSMHAVYLTLEEQQHQQPVRMDLMPVAEELLVADQYAPSKSRLLRGSPSSDTPGPADAHRADSHHTQSGPSVYAQSEPIPPSLPQSQIRRRSMPVFHFERSTNRSQPTGHLPNAQRPTVNQATRTSGATALNPTITSQSCYPQRHVQYPRVDENDRIRALRAAIPAVGIPRARSHPRLSSVSRVGGDSPSSSETLSRSATGSASRNSRARVALQRLSDPATPRSDADFEAQSSGTTAAQAAAHSNADDFAFDYPTGRGQHCPNESSTTEPEWSFSHLSPLGGQEVCEMLPEWLLVRNGPSKVETKAPHNLPRKTSHRLQRSGATNAPFRSRLDISPPSRRRPRKQVPKYFTFCAEDIQVVLPLKA